MAIFTGMDDSEGTCKLTGKPTRDVRRIEKHVPRAFIYLRVSSQRQGVSGLGAEAQEATCRAWAAMRGVEVAGVYVDKGASGMLPPRRREGLSECLKAMAPRDVLLVHSLSRCARRPLDLWTLVDGGKVQLVSATEPFDMTTAMGQAFMGILSVLAQLESNLASERSRGAAAARIRRGEAATRAENLVPGAAAVALRMRAEGASQRAIVAELNRLGIKGAEGRRWHLPTVQRMLLRIAPVAPREDVVTIWKQTGGDMAATAERFGIDAAEFARWLTVDTGLRRALVG